MSDNNDEPVIPSYDEPEIGYDFLNDFKVTKKWLKGGGVGTVDLARELRRAYEMITKGLGPTLMARIEAPEPETFAESLTDEQLAPGQERFKDVSV